MARKKKDNLDSWNKSLGYSDESLKALSSGNYDQWSGNRNAKYNTAKEQTQQAKELPVLKQYSAPQDEYTSRLSSARKYQQNLENEAKKYQYNDTLAAANTLDKQDQGYLQRLVDRFGDGDLVRSSLAESKKDAWEKKYGKSIDQIYDDFMADQGNAKMRQGEDNFVMSTIASTLGGIAKPFTALPQLASNIIAPESDFAKTAEKTRADYSEQLKRLKAGAKEHLGDKGDSIYDTASMVGERMLLNAAGNVLGGPLGAGILTGLADTSDQMDLLNLRPDMDNRKKALTALAHGTVEGVGNAITRGALDKIPSVSGIGGKLINVGKGAGNAAIENTVSEAVERYLDNAINGDLSEKELNKGLYMLQGMSEDEAAKKAQSDQNAQIWNAAKTGALFGGATKALGEAGNAIKNLPMLKGMSPDVDTSDIDDVISKATQQAEGAQANINKLADQIPENWTVDDIERAAGQEPVKTGLKPLAGAELDAANKEIASIDNKINALKGDIEQWSKQKNNKGDTTNAAKKKIKAAEAEMKRLEDTKKPIYRRINGEPTPVIEQIEHGKSVNIFKNYVKEVGNLTEEGKKVAKEANALLDNYIETGDKNVATMLLKKIGELHELSKDDAKYFKDWGGTENGIVDQLLTSGSPLARAMEEARAIHANRAAESAPVETPAMQVQPNPIGQNYGNRPYAKLSPEAERVDAALQAERMGIESPEDAQILAEQRAKLETPEPASRDLKIETVNLKGGKKGYYVSEAIDDTTTRNVEPGKVYKTEAEAQAAMEELQAKADVQPKLDPAHDLANRYAEAFYAADDYGYRDLGDGVGDLLVENLAEDIEKGRDLSGYIQSIEENIEDTEIYNPEAAANLRQVMAELEELQASRFNGPEDVPPIENVPTTPKGPVDNEGAIAPEEMPTAAAGGSVPPNGPKPPTPNLEEGKNLSQRYNTLINSDLIKSSKARMQMVENAKQAGVFDKGIEKRLKAQQAALQEYLADEQGAINDLASRQWDSGKDVDMSMLILQDALDSNNQAWTNMTLLKQAVETKAAGRELRALRDYSYGNTREGTLAKAADYLVDKAEAHLKSNKTNAKLTSAAEKIAKGDFSALEKSGMDESNIQNIIEAVNHGANADQVKLMLAMYESVGSTGISKEAMSKLNGLYARMSATGATSKARDDIMQDVFKVLADDIGGKRTWREMWDSWRYLAMLGNPKTHIRNMLGNTTHRMVTEAKDNVAAVMEEALDRANKAAGGKGIERTKALLGAEDQGLIDLAARDADDVAYASLNDLGNKYNVKDEIGRARNSFNSKVLSKIDELNSKALNLEDYSALKKKYSRSLARYLKANGADESIFDATDDASKALLQKARDYAVDQAKQATFHEYSKAADYLSRMSNDLRSDGKLSHKLAGAALEGLVPFKKTPINILKQGVKYSPISLAKAIGKMYDAVKTGNSTAADAIEDLASGLTGTGIMGLGAFLAHEGLLTGGANDSYNVDQAETEQGAQNYALKIGDKSYTLDWLAPMSMPLFVGAELMNQAKGRGDDEDIIDRVIGSISTIAEPVTEMSMLQGIQNILNELSYSKENAFATIGANTALGYVSQGLPTLGGQFARAIDDTRRNTYTDQPAGFRRQFDKAITKDLNKIPFLSMGNEAYIDSSGQTQQNEGLATSLFGNNFGTRLMDQMLSPGYYKEGNVTDVDRELNRLYEATGSDVYKDVASGKIDTAGTKLSKEAFTKYQQLYGGNNDKLYNALINSDEYNGLDDTEKVKMISDIKSFSKLIADHEIGGKELTDSNQKKYDIYKAGGIDGVIKYFKDNAKAKSLGLTYDNYTKQEAKNPGGAEQYVSDVEQARQYGFLKKDGTLNMQQFYNALDYAGDDPASIQAYADYRAQGFENNPDRIAYLIDDPTFSNEQKGRIIGGLNPDKFKKTPKAMYDMGGYDGLWNYYMLKYLADTDGNGRVSKAESDALLNSDNPYVTALPDDQYYFLAGTLYK